MDKWKLDNASAHINDFNTLDSPDQKEFLDFLNTSYPPQVYTDAVERLRRAQANISQAKSILDGAEQVYPEMVNVQDGTASDLAGYGIVFTAGGEGERLRLSLMRDGVQPDDLADFTKATYPLENFFGDYGALHANCAIVADICHAHQIDIPVVVTTGPQGSITSRVIPEMLARFNNFGLKQVMVVEQESRLHLTQDEKIVYHEKADKMVPVTNPDETGGPIMKLKKPATPGGASYLDELIRLGCTKLILLQGTAIYDPALLFNMAKAGCHHDAVGVGIARDAFSEDDPYGTFVVVSKDNRHQLIIVEQDVRNEKTRTLKQGANYLPYNTGLYIFDCQLLQQSDLPDYATPPKEILPDLPRAPKVGFAATDIV